MPAMRFATHSTPCEASQETAALIVKPIKPTEISFGDGFRKKEMETVGHKLYCMVMKEVLPTFI